VPIISIARLVVELAGGLQDGSVSLLADAFGCFGDAANYGISLLVLGMALTWRARAARFKGLTMGAFVRCLRQPRRLLRAPRLQSVRTQALTVRTRHPPCDEPQCRAHPRLAVVKPHRPVALPMPAPTL
jgi:hypothetical protein